ncbi:hypothetical protein [Stenotrophomonas sp. GZD-301]|uniref:hypothetical protein n=1 Tax=Stenotrophomonas sp. GZD-301 TaxID=3404814 RepID=UPI003BB691D4
MYQVGIAFAHPSDQACGCAGRIETSAPSIEHGVDRFWEELRPGLQRLAGRFNWCWVGRLPVEVEGGATRFGHVRRHVVETLKALMHAGDAAGHETFVFFVADWPEDDQCRYGSGSIADLEGYLRLFDDWDEWIYRADRDSMQQGHGTPLLVRVRQEP